MEARPPTTRTPGWIRHAAWLVLALMLLGLALRLLVWRWHEQYPLGGDEREYFEQALRWLQGQGYRELPLMRPPLYTVFLAVVFQLFDSQVQRVRLVQALISTATIGFVWLWSRELLGRHRGALAATALAALCYTFASNATELLTETLFVAGLTAAFCLLARSAPGRATRRAWLWAIGAGLSVGALTLLRSVALPLVPLGAAWLCLPLTWRGVPVRRWITRAGALQAALFVLGAVAMIAPWTLRNYAVYRTPIIVDTTGAENLWLDNEPAGREAAKRQLYAMGDDRGARQRVAMERGLAAIAADPGRFVAKAWAEAQHFFALEYFDDLRRRPAIWVPPLEVWLRLLLGDGIWLAVLGGGIVGLWLGPNGRFKWLLVPWVLYVFLTGLVFHVELRYRLPVYPALLPFAGWSVASIRRLPALTFMLRQRWSRALGAAATLAAVLGLVLLHRGYPVESLMLARKHLHLWRSDPARIDGPDSEMRDHATAALALDPGSALARVRLGLLAPVADERRRWWREAIEVLPAHPYAHLLLGNSLRLSGDDDAAREELDFETNSLEDLQSWSRQTFDRAPVTDLDVGGGLDLGLISGFHPAADDARWTTGRATLGPIMPGAALTLRLRSPRPSAAPPAVARIWLADQLLGELALGPDWRDYTVEVPGELQGRPAMLRLASNTFRPRAYNRASPDNRDLGVEVDRVGSIQNR